MSIDVLGYNCLSVEPAYASGGTGGLNPPMELDQAIEVALEQSEKSPKSYIEVSGYPSGEIVAICHAGTCYMKVIK